MKVIKRNSKGAQVTRWQFFLVGLGYNYIKVDGDFGPNTLRATIDFQEKNGLTGDGAVGEQTYIKAFYAGYNNIEAQQFPDKPNFNPLTSNSQRAAIFGKFSYKSAGDDTETIIVTDDWEKNNIVTVEIPQLEGVSRDPFPASTKVRFHKLGAKQLQALFADWEQAGLLPLILTWAGSYVPRFVRGSRTTLSNHSFGTAFDINPVWNGLGRIPALVGQKGSVRELVKIAHKNGFYWGGHFSRSDGMHFEVAKVKK